jgi:NADH-quinone oxidoreductase subunit J
MLTEGGTGLGGRQRNEQAAVGAAVAAAMAALFIAVAVRTGWTPPAPGAALPTYTPGAIGQSFLRQNILVFEGTSIVLLVSLMGAILIARRED